MSKKPLFDWNAERRKRENVVRTEVAMGLRSEDALQEFEEKKDLPPPVAKVYPRKSRAKYETSEERRAGMKRIDREKIRELNSRGWSNSQIAQELNCATESVRRIVLHELGIESASKDKPVRKGQYTHEEILEVVNRTSTYEEAARELGLSRGSIYYHLKHSRAARAGG